MRRFGVSVASADPNTSSCLLALFSPGTLVVEGDAVRVYFRQRARSRRASAVTGVRRESIQGDSRSPMLERLGAIRFDRTGSRRAGRAIARRHRLHRVSTRR
jgi:hypothetical protein